MNLPPGWSGCVQDWLLPRILIAVEENNNAQLEQACRNPYFTRDRLHVKLDGDTVLHLAAQKVTDPEILRTLCRYGAQLDARDAMRGTALHSALYFGKVANAEVLCSLGASVTAKDSDGWAAIHNAAHSGKVDALNLLLRKYIALDEGDNNGDTALHICCEGGKKKFAQALVDLRVDVDASNKTAWTPLHTAANKGHADIVALLLKAGAKVNAKTQDGWTALHCAARKARKDVIVELKGKGADLSIKNKDGKTAYEVASANEKEIRALLHDPKLTVAAAKPTASRQSNATGSASRHSNSGSIATADELAAWLSLIGVADQILPVCGQLGLTALSDVQLVLESDLAGVGVPPVSRRKFMEAAALVPRSVSTGTTGSGKKQPFVAMPFPQFTESSSAIFDGHAEKLAVSYMKWLGYNDARTNGTVHAKDRGIDVISTNGVAQVKANFRGDVKRNAVSQLIGDASVPAYSKRDLLFFAVSYAQDATSFVQELNGRGVMLFTFDGAGKVKPLNAQAVQKVRSVL